MIPLMKNAFLNEQETKEELSKFIMRANRLSMDVECKNFEKKFSEFQGSKEATLFNSGGSANLAGLQALKNLGRLKDNSKIGFSALTWSTNVMPIIQLNMVPVPIDCNINTLNVMSGNLKERLKEEKLDALFITNVLGFAGDLEEIKNICKEENIILLEDNCEALGSEINGKKTGTFGDFASFSFFVAHHMSTIEGGMLCSDDEEIIEMLKIVRANGWDRNLDAKSQHKWRNKFDIKSEFHAKYTFYDLGYNLRPTEITGFLGSYQLQFLKDNIKRREENYNILSSVAKENDDLITLDRSHIDVLSSFAYPVICKDEKTKEKYMAQLSGAGVEIRPMIAGNIQAQPFYNKYVDKNYNLPDTEKIHNQGFYFGNYPELTENDLEILKSSLGKY